MERIGIISSASIASVLFARNLGFEPEFLYFNSSAEFDPFARKKINETYGHEDLTFYSRESSVSLQIPKIVTTIENLPFPSPLAAIDLGVRILLDTSLDRKVAQGSNALRQSSTTVLT
jgi:hypothetical protein